MRIAVIGTGYVGLVTGVCFAEYGNTVWCVDTDKVKIDGLNNGIVPIYEPGLEDLVTENCANGHLHFTTETRQAVNNSDIVFIAVGTPQGEDGSADLHYVLQAAADIGACMDHHLYVVIKSTVPVGTNAKAKRAIQDELDRRGSELTFDMVSNPEFLKEGSAVIDCQRPDRIVIGTENEEARKVMYELYRHFVQASDSFIFMDIPSAEMTKYAANAMLATKISFINEISNICERLGADVNKVRLGIGSDKRIGYQFIYPGCGYGGSCFPKDVRALLNSARESGYEPEILRSVDTVNEEQKKVLPQKILSHFGEDLSGRCFAVWGLSFKPNTDDMRMAPSVVIINELIQRGAIIRAYDPKAMEEAQRFYFKGCTAITYTKNKYDALDGADALILITEWKEFRNPDFEEIRQRLDEPIVFDGRNQYDADMLAKLGFSYYQIGVKRK